MPGSPCAARRRAQCDLGHRIGRNRGHHEAVEPVEAKGQGRHARGKAGEDQQRQNGHHREDIGDRHFADRLVRQKSPCRSRDAQCEFEKLGKNDAERRQRHEQKEAGEEKLFHRMFLSAARRRVSIRAKCATAAAAGNRAFYRYAEAPCSQRARHGLSQAAWLCL